MTEETTGDWAIVELMGHRQRGGIIQEVERFGTKMLRIDVPAGDAFVTEYYGGSSIYALRPATEEIARGFAERCGDPRPVSPVAYRIAAPEPDFHDEDLDDDERPF